MSLGESDAKFPGQQGLAEPPPQTRENPGQVYPKTDPSAAPLNSVPGTGTNRIAQQYLGNPYLQNSIFWKLDKSLTEVIQTIEREQSGVGGSPEEVALVDKFKRWKDELEVIMAGGVSMRDRNSGPVDGIHAEEGGLFND
ncbi:hypothetical protein PILCRDRAFT_812791 [Piloderma croceum F 1598]|uniref:Uncharacterized protein n=1 Tax=Piloderma croceum (strain F 1598) TaxID=765440 RepID=A0A0C3GH93_PILCF|nr:hypothetical protein PILCRDRAFT_812791 [Piloderma croceum F 1598]